MEQNINKIEEIEGDDTLIPESNVDTENIYPANVKVSRDVFSVYELKRKYEERGSVVLDPDFQRENVWSRKQKSELVESILMGIPLPVMYFAEDKLGNLQVIDGRQRLTALFTYLNNDFPISSAPILSSIKGKNFSQLEQKDQVKLEDYQIIVYIIKPSTPDRIKFDIFDRVNRGGTQLNKQEMRNALYQGESTKLLSKLSKSQEFQKATNGAINATRMKDKYLILRFLAFYLYQKKNTIDPGYDIAYKSDIDDFLGKTMEYMNLVDKNIIKKLEEIFYLSMSNTYTILGKDAFRIPNKQRKRPINMALFESLSYLMSHNLIVNKKGLVQTKIHDAFQDEKFISSLTERIDSSVSVEIRFSKMNTIIQEIKNARNS